MSIQVDPFRINTVGPWGCRVTIRDRSFRQVKPASYNASLTGVSRDNSGVALGGATVKLFRTWDDTMIASTVSDGSGNWTLYPASSGPYYLVEYKSGSPDVAGTSVNTLAAV